VTRKSCERLYYSCHLLSSRQSEQTGVTALTNSTFDKNCWRRILVSQHHRSSFLWRLVQPQFQVLIAICFAGTHNASAGCDHLHTNKPLNPKVYARKRSASCRQDSRCPHPIHYWCTARKRKDAQRWASHEGCFALASAVEREISSKSQDRLESTLDSRESVRNYDSLADDSQ
jgi:hypothetical protein